MATSPTVSQPIVINPCIAPLSSPPGSDIALWLIALETDPGCWDHAVLSAPEQERAQRFRFAVHAQRYRASHVALRLILGQAAGVPPAALEFTEGLHGKPRLANAGIALHFNLSHSGGWGLVGVCQGHPIGVDLELISPMGDAATLAQRHFSATEYADFQSTPPDQRLVAFLRGWTRKEACLKALGSGLSIEPHEFEAGLGTITQHTAIAVNGQPCSMSVGCVDVPIQALAACAKLDLAASSLAM